jgi:hypothetical protein
MVQDAASKSYKSPDYKLLPFFENSRNNWKAKAQLRQRRLRLQQNRISALETSRRKWKERACDYRLRYEEAVKQLEKQKSSAAC